jgi:dGTPase
MRNDGGFEGNGQTLRILARLESFSEEHGADVTRRTLLGVLKYPASYEVVANPALMPKIETKPQTIRLIDREASKPPKCYLKSEHEVVEWVLSPLQQAERDTFTSVNPITDKKKHPKARFKSFDCSIMDVADDIAYGVHDLEDAIAMGLISERDFRSAIGEIICAPYIDMMKQRKPDESHNNIYEVLVSSLFGTGKQRKHYIGRLVHLFITGVEVVEESELIEHLIRFNVVLNKDKKVLLDALQTLIEENVIKSAEVQHLEFKGQKMVVSVFEALACDPKALLPADTFAAYKDAGDDLRTVCDYVAGMTDGFLLKTYDRLFSPRMGSVFDKI